MKKLLVLILLVFTATILTGCSSYYNAEQVDEQILVLNNKIEELKIEVEELKPTPQEEFMTYLLAQSNDVVFINMSEEYSEDVDAYGYSKTYVYKIEKETTFKIEIIVDNDLEFTWYSNYLNDEGTAKTVRPSLFNTAKSFTITIKEGYFIFDFESWDEYSNSVVTFIVEKVGE